MDLYRKVTFRVVELIAREFDELDVIANFCCVVRLIYKLRVGDKADEIERISDSRNIHNASNSQEVYGERGRQHLQNDRPPWFFIDFKICEESCHFLIKRPYER